MIPHNTPSTLQMNNLIKELASDHKLGNKTVLTLCSEIPRSTDSLQCFPHLSINIPLILFSYVIHVWNIEHTAFMN